MVQEISKNIAAYRKRRGVTQEELANQLNVSFQAVSKWENGQSMPDISLLGSLAAALDTDINTIMGYPHSRKQVTYYEDKYVGDAYYWGTEPSGMCYDVMKLCPPVRKLRVLDIGCGEGKNAVFFARNGYVVDAFDLASSGVEKTKRLAENCGVFVNSFQANLLDYRLEQKYDIIFASGVLQYIPESLRAEIIGNYQSHTTQNGLNAFNFFVHKPFIDQAPDHEATATLWKSGELAMHYADWRINNMSETIFDCNSSGIPHRHCMDYLFAIKP